MDINLNTQISVNKANLTTLQAAIENSEAKPELSPLLARSANVTVSAAPMDLEKLVATLTNESADTKEAAAKTKLNSVFTTVLAKAIESGNISESNMTLLEQADSYDQQLSNLNVQINTLNAQVRQYQATVKNDEKTVNDLQNKVDSLTNNVTQLQNEVDSLQEQIDEAEAGGADATQLRQRLATAQENLDAELTKLNNANEQLTAAQSKLAASRLALSNARDALAAANGQKAQLEQNITDTINSITDENLARELAEALKLSAADVTNVTEDDKAERSKAEEKYLDTHSPVRIIQDAINNHDRELLDTIEKKRETKI